jgi:hypothetical protein
VSGISRVDQAVVQLRAQLQRLARQRAERRGGPERPAPGPLERLGPASSLAAAGEDDFRRKFVRALLTEELGEGIANEPEFDRIAGEVWQLLDEDNDTRAMMDTAIARLR